MNKVCKQCGGEFEVTDDDLEFLKKVFPIFDGQKYEIPVSNFCPICRHQRRLAFRNERSLYKRKCDLTGKEIMSIYTPDSSFKVYNQNVWWGDKWDGFDYGRDFDFKRDFNEQLKELYRDVPHMSLYTTNCENSYYTNYAINQKNCYLIFGAGDNEDCLFGKFIVFCKDVVDSLTVYSCEYCYEGIASERCYGCRFFINCRGCSDCMMVEECLACRNCISCFGLQSKQYCIMNKQYSREEYEKLAEEYEYLTQEKIEFLKGHLDRLKANLPHIQSHIFASEDCTGDGVYNCKNCYNAFDSKDCEDCKYIYFTPKSIWTQDCAFCAPDGVKFCYNICSTLGLENSMACFYTWRGSDLYYCMECHYCNDCFGCVGLKHKQYCVFNKQYSKEEYEKLVARIVEHMQGTGEWGEFFPFEISPFAYNETIAQEYFPLSKGEALERGLIWRDMVDKKHEGGIYKAPEDIRDVEDNICEKVLICKETEKPFKVVPQELKFYRKMKLPIPKKHPDVRHFDRLKVHSSYELWDRKCMKCGGNMETIYPDSSGLKVYCEECYLKEVY